MSDEEQRAVKAALQVRGDRIYVQSEPDEIIVQSDMDPYPRSAMDRPHEGAD